GKCPNWFQVFRGTITDAPDFDPSVDAETLYNAMKGIGSDKEAILDLVTGRSNAQRQEIVKAYKSSYGKDLIDDLKYELTGKFERLIVSLMRPQAYHDAKEIHDALKGAGTDEKCLIEVLASRNNQQIHALVAAYKDAYGSDLEEDIIGDTSGHFKKMLIVLLQGTRDDPGLVYPELVEEDAQALYDAGEAQWGTEESIFIMLLGNRSVTHLRMVFDKYQEIAEKAIEDSIKSELSGDFERLMLAIVQCIRSVPMYFAKRLYKSMKGLGTQDNTLIRIMICRSEIDMLDIRECFRMGYEKSLYNMIKEDTSGDYKRTLLALCGGDDDLAGEFFPEAAQLAYKMWEISSMTKVQLRPTIRPASEFDPADDAQNLRKAMKGFGTDEDTIINIVVNRSNEQRQEIKQVFKSLLGRDLMKDLKSELSKNLERLIIGLMLTPAEFDAKMMRKAIEGAGTDEHALIEILVTRTNEQIHAMNAAYKHGETRYVKNQPNYLANRLYKAMKVGILFLGRHCGNDLANYLKLLMSTKNLSSLDFALFRIFSICVDHMMRTAVAKVTVNWGLNNIVIFLSFLSLYPLQGIGTDDRALIRIMVSRSEIDLFNIRKEFKETHDCSLHEFIQVETMVVSSHFMVCGRPYSCLGISLAHLTSSL
uniref:Annexin n=1 Tax=Esox lucius TaxID=8010 RepID=A0A6Q2X7X7_ESOLU